MASGESPRRSTSVTDGSTGAHLRQLHYSFPQRFEGAFESLLSHFVDCMDGNYSQFIELDNLLISWLNRSLRSQTNIWQLLF